MLTLIDGALERFVAEDDGQPVVMLNLLRFKPDGGRERYADYLNEVAPLLARYGAELVYLGEGMSPLSAEPGQDWDSIALVRYPNRRAFMSMAQDPDYHERTGPVRQSALLEAVLQPTRVQG